MLSLLGLGFSVIQFLSGNTWSNGAQVAPFEVAGLRANFRLKDYRVEAVNTHEEAVLVDFGHLDGIAIAGNLDGDTGSHNALRLI